ncbi:transposable element Tcb1 transposase [Trichonephila clavipes]|nr:transposable element Tcb1 transposase [Trichonephila clavipes]
MVAYRDCGLSFREIGSRVGRNQTLMRICDRWMQEGTTHRRGRSHLPQCTTLPEWSVRKTSIAWSTLDAEPQTSPLPVVLENKMWAAEWNEVVFTDESRIGLQHHDGRIRVWRHCGDRMLNSCVIHHHTGPAPGIMVWSGVGYHSRTPLVRIAAGEPPMHLVTTDNRVFFIRMATAVPIHGGNGVPVSGIGDGLTPIVAIRSLPFP